MRVGIDVGVGMMGVSVGIAVAGAVIRIIVGTPLAVISSGAFAASRWLITNRAPMMIIAVNMTPPNSQKSGELIRPLFAVESSEFNRFVQFMFEGDE